jgi:hypothetical protein
MEDILQDEIDALEEEAQILLEENQKLSAKLEDNERRVENARNEGYAQGRRESLKTSPGTIVRIRRRSIDKEGRASSLGMIPEWERRAMMDDTSETFRIEEYAVEVPKLVSNHARMIAGVRRLLDELERARLMSGPAHVIGPAKSQEELMTRFLAENYIDKSALDLESWKDTF